MTVSAAIAQGYRLQQAPIEDDRTGRPVKSWVLSLNGEVVSIRRDVPSIIHDLQEMMNRGNRSNFDPDH